MADATSWYKVPKDTLCQCGHVVTEHKHRGWLPSFDCDGCAADAGASEADWKWEIRIHGFVAREEAGG